MSIDISTDWSTLCSYFYSRIAYGYFPALSVDQKPGDSSIYSDPTTLDTIARWEDVLRAVDSALDRLRSLAAIIMDASANRVGYTVSTFLTDDDTVFRRDAASLVQWRFPAAGKGLCQQLGDSIAVRRRMLLLKHPYARKLTVRRVAESDLSMEHSQNSQPESEPMVTLPAPAVKYQMVRRFSNPSSSITDSSVLDPQAPLLRRVYAPSQPALTTVVSTISFTQEDSFEYPPAPKANQGETRVQCPYCLMPLDCRELEKREDEYWRQHIDHDIKPYNCLFPECAERLVLFSDRHEWRLHMESMHSRSWPRKVHTTVWFCDIDHNPPEQFETELQWRKHMKDSNSHPKRKLTEPTTAQLDALSPRKQHVTLREPLTCPLCERIPEEIRSLVEKEGENQAAMYEVLVNHVANHIQSLSLISLPCLDNDSVPAAADGESIAINECFRGSLN